MQGQRGGSKEGINLDLQMAAKIMDMGCVPQGKWVKGEKKRPQSDSRGRPTCEGVEERSSQHA
jgi:hypothetical protein